jgi:hypothetical protein
MAGEGMKKTLSLQACDNGDIKIFVNNAESHVIKNNQTNDEEIFKSLEYQPGCLYERGADVSNKSVNISVFQEICGLFDSIVKGINEINETPHVSVNEPEIDNE